MSIFRPVFKFLQHQGDIETKIWAGKLPTQALKSGNTHDVASGPFSRDGRRAQHCHGLAHPEPKPASW